MSVDAVPPLLGLRRRSGLDPPKTAPITFRRFLSAQQQAILDISLDHQRFEATSVNEYLDLFASESESAL
jgi:hypothetical protein